MNRLDDVLHYQQDPVFGGAAAAGPTPDGRRLEGCLELRNVTFGYSRLERAAHQRTST